MTTNYLNFRISVRSGHCDDIRPGRQKKNLATSLRYTPQISHEIWYVSHTEFRHLCVQVAYRITVQTN